MADRKELLANKSRPLEMPAIYRRGRVTNSGAYLRGYKGDKGAGRTEEIFAQFIKDIAPAVAEAEKEHGEEYIEGERASGIAKFQKATPEQRKQMYNALRNDTLSEGQSPYFREGVQIAYTKNLLSKYNQDLFQRYEQWEKKNDPSSGTFQDFLSNFEAEYDPYFETINEEILAEHFVPMQMGIRNQLQQRHTEHLNKNYRDESYNTMAANFWSTINDDMPEVMNELITEDLIEARKDFKSWLGDQKISRSEQQRALDILEPLVVKTNKGEKLTDKEEASLEALPQVAKDWLKLRQKFGASKATQKRLQENIDVALSSSFPIKEINEALEIQTAEDKPIDYSSFDEYPGQSKIWHGNEGLLSLAKSQGMSVQHIKPMGGKRKTDGIRISGGPLGDIIIDKKKGESQKVFEQRVLKTFKYVIRTPKK